jgi:nucleotide-binding universal stress UspA family protein
MTFKRILIPIDGSLQSAHAAQTGLDLARALGAEVATVFVVEPPVAYSGEIGIPAAELLEVSARDDEEALSAVKRSVQLPPDAPHFVRAGHPAEIIGKVAAEWPADLIVMGSRGLGGLGRALLGSVADAVVRHAPCPVLVTRGSG